MFRKITWMILGILGGLAALLSLLPFKLDDRHGYGLIHTLASFMMDLARVYLSAG